jgi:hypothetical protein
MSRHDLWPIKATYMKHMKTKSKDEKDDGLRPEYDLAALLKEGVRSK